MMVAHTTNGNDVMSSNASNVYDTIQSISSMVLNIIQTTVTTQKELAGSMWNMLPWKNFSAQITKNKVTGRKDAARISKLFSW